MNPATFLRVNGPEPWNVCYPEPSVRPDDSRYGNNPNRVQRHTQFQVIMKPDPGNPQELYLGSLEALGINTRAHDIRFVEDNWVGNLRPQTRHCEACALLTTNTKPNTPLSALPGALHLAACSLTLPILACLLTNTSMQHVTPNLLMLISLSWVDAGSPNSGGVGARMGGVV